jgi:hypothetical protein
LARDATEAVGGGGGAHPVERRRAGETLWGCVPWVEVGDGCRSRAVRPSLLGHDVH